MHTILIIDERNTSQLMLLQALRDEFEILEACDSVQAMALLAQQGDVISAILLALDTPHLDGHALLAQMQKSETLAQIPVLVAARGTQQGTLSKALPLGACDCIMKPYDIDILRQRLHNAIKLREATAMVHMLQRQRTAALAAPVHQALSVREALLLALKNRIRASNDLAYVKDCEGAYLCCTKPFLQMVGLQEEQEIEGKTDFDLFGEEIAAQYRADDIAIMRTGQSMVDREECVPAKDGSTRYIKISKYSLQDFAGESIGVYGVGMDVTEHRDEYARLNLLTDSIPGGLAAYEIKEKGLRLLYASDGFFTFSGYTREEYERLAARNPLCLVHEADIPQINRCVEQILHEGLERVECVYRAITKEGDVRFFHMRGAVMERSDTSVVLGMVRLDITDQRRSDEEGRIHEEEYRLAIANSGNLVYRYTVATHTIDISPEAALLFAHPPRVTDVPDSLIAGGSVAKESEETLRDFYARIDRGEKTGSMTACRRTIDGQYRWFFVRFSTIFSDDGQPVSAIILFEDVTQEREKHKKSELDRSRLIAALRTVYPVSVGLNFTNSTFKLFSGADRLPASIREVGSIDELIAAATAQIMPEYTEAFLGTLRIEALLQAFAAGSDSVRMEYRRITEQGEPQWIEIIVMRAENRFDNEIKGIALARNIDEQKNTEQALKQALKLTSNELSKEREYQRVIAQSSPDGTIILRPDDNQLLYVSGMLLGELGYSNEEFAALARDRFENFVLPEDYSTAFRDIGVRHQFKQLRFEQEYRARRKNGSVVWLHENGTLTRLENGDPAYIIVGTDITRRKEMEERLRMSEEELMLAMSQMGKMVYTYDAVAQTLTLPESYADRRGACTIGFPFSPELRTRFSMAHQKAFVAFHDAIRGGARTGEQEISISTPNGSTRYERAQFFTIFDQKGMPVKAVISLEDITQQHIKDDETAAIKRNEHLLQMVAAHSNRAICRYEIGCATMYADMGFLKGFHMPRVCSNMPETAIQGGYLMEESIQDFRHIFEEIHSGKPEGDAKLHMRNNDGGTLWVNMRYSIIEWADERPVTAALSFADITADHEKEMAFERYHLLTQEEETRPGVAFFDTDLTADVVERQGVNVEGVTFPSCGCTHNETMEYGVYNLVPQLDRDDARALLSRDHLIAVFTQGTRSITKEMAAELPDGRERWFQLEIQLFQDPYSGHIRSYTMLHDVTEKKADELDVRRRAQLDGMTGLYNKTTAETLIRERLSRADGSPCALLLVDLDNLKSINDLYGHDRGDEAIRQIAQTLAEQFRKTDIVGRVGGDEFVVFLDSGGNESKLHSMLTSFMNRLMYLHVGRARQISLQGSIGLAAGIIGQDSYETLFRQADRALYHVKRNGKNDFAIYRPEMEEAFFQHVGRPAARAAQPIAREKGDGCRLLCAVSALYPMVLSVNLTRNSYRVVQCDARFLRDCADASTFDDLIAQAAKVLHPEDVEAYLHAFSRESLLAASLRGEACVSCESRRIGEDGTYSAVQAEMVLSGREENGDVMGMLLSGKRAAK